ncbi:MAG: hypothetical protein KDE48_16955 [Anaerolineales bacterium]|uniref:Uncharacterized protein n=1 Tax=candidate division WWE3 bacterium TaxID=2053526 RepID=A0A955LW35_UNCKA|nr:hypothetical protein [candidate division WWE3 bacterium]MCA9951344.1 hypothetical protein [Anaerolineales bacterium]
MASIFRDKDRPGINQGDIYKYTPIIWLDPPLVIVRDVAPSLEGTVQLRHWSSLRDAAFNNDIDNQEYILAKGKVRYLIVLSTNIEIRNASSQYLLVAPLYSIPRWFTSGQISLLQTQELPNHFYVPRDDESDLREGVLKTTHIQRLNREFLEEEQDTERSLTRRWVDAIIQWYKDSL